jgi:SAM-dependent methyltransferase
VSPPRGSHGQAGAPEPLATMQPKRSRSCGRRALPRLLAGAALALAVGACSAAPGPAVAQEPAPPGLAAQRFPKPARPVAGIVSDQWSDEDGRERVGEAAKVMDLLGVRPGMAVADIGAGAGYYVVRLSARVGAEGRVVAEDIERPYLDRLRGRVARERLSNVSLVLGEPHDPRLPPRSVDVALLVHMYHEIAQPFGLLANLVPALRPGGRVAIVDQDGPTRSHGTPRALLACELAAVGYRQVAFDWIEDRSVYLAVFEPPAAPPEPERIRACDAR